ncbi:MAG: beta-ketoacyl synthase N-terminal-like domain-containing protein, partial [Candidatus Omnitrophota bacterium]
MKKNRVVVTGLGVVSSIGIGKDEFWKNAISGKSGISKVSGFDTKEFRCHCAGEVKNFHPEEYISKRRIPFLGRTSQLSIAAAILAFKDAKLSFKNIGKEAGVIMGTTMGERPMEESIDTWVKEGHSKISKSKILQSQASNISTNLAIYFKIPGINYLIPTACSAGNYAVGYGFDLIKAGELKYALVGGADA